MQTPLNTLDTKKTIDYDNLNIVTRPRPPRRRQSGVSLIPFRPYVKRLSSVREPFSWTNGFDKWVVMGRHETYFTQPNARCIGSLLADCETSDVIRWDIEGASTRLPMVCKLWMIVDGAVVERGKPHLVQDAAMQVFTSGQNLLGIMAARHCTKPSSLKRTYDRRRRQSWHDVNEYHGVPYFQYTRAVEKGINTAIQCDMDHEYCTSKQEVLLPVKEETVYETAMHQCKHAVVQETIHNFPLQTVDHFHLAIRIHTDSGYVDRSTSTEPDLARMFNLNFEKNEIVLSAIADPYRRAVPSNYASKITKMYRNNVEYYSRSVSTGDDYPHGWIRYDTDFILSDLVKYSYEEKEQSIVAPFPHPCPAPLPPPPPPPPIHTSNIHIPPPVPRVPSLKVHHPEDLQAVLENCRLSSKSIRLQNSSTSSFLTSNYYERIDDVDERTRRKPYCPICDEKKATSHNYESISKPITSSSTASLKRCENDSNLFSPSFTDVSKPLNATIESEKSAHINSNINNNPIVRCCCCVNEPARTRIKSSSSASTVLLASLLERYERTLLERQRAFDIAADELYNMDHVFRRYRQQIHDSSIKQTNMAMELYRGISSLSSQGNCEKSSSFVARIMRDKYRSMPGLTCEDMIKAYMPSPRLFISRPIINSEEQQYVISPRAIARPGYCDLCVSDVHASSAWVRYNEQKVEELQQRINLMLRVENTDEPQILISRPIHPIPQTIAERIDDILIKRSRHRHSSSHDYHRALIPRRNSHRPLHRLNPPSFHAPRLFNRSSSCMTRPISRRNRLVYHSVPPRSTKSSSEKSYSTIDSMSRRKKTPSAVSSLSKFDEISLPSDSKVDDDLYVLTQYTIPRYYRLYTDVNFRKMYDFSRLLDTCLDSSRSSREDYSMLVKDLALEQLSVSPITSIA